MPYDHDLDLAIGIDRRAFLKVMGYGGAGLLVGGSMLPRAFADDCDPSTIASMEIDVSYRTEIKSLPSNARTVRVWMPLPPSDYAQEVRGLSVKCSVPYELKVENTYGNSVACVETPADSGKFVIESRYTVSRRRVGAEKASLDARSRQKYLKLTKRVRVTDEVAAFTQSAVGAATEPMEVGRKVYDAIIDLLIYDKKIPGCGTGDTGWIMRHKRGKCDDYHALFMAMMISRGVPVRWEQGFPLPYPGCGGVTSGGIQGDCSGAHCWASFYDPEAGWVPVDVSEGDKQPPMRDFYFGHLTPNRFKISEGRAITLNPKQGGDALSTFAYAYAEADGLPLIYPANYENTIKYTITSSKTAKL